MKRYNGKLECVLCPHFCKIAPGKTGICGVRKNTGKKIELLTFGVISGLSLDPVEKKPLYHFFPGNNILSIGSYGCNMRCDFCQNYNISQNIPEGIMPEIAPQEILNNVLSAKKNIGLAFTYNEPVIWFEFVKEAAVLVKTKGLYTAMITNGFINPDPLNELSEVIDAFNVDLKAFNNDFYKRLTGASLEPVKKTLKQIVKAGRHLEITTLLITGQNDNAGEMENQAKWIESELGNDIPLHLSRYFPMYKRDDPTTPHNTLLRHYETASKYLKYVYLGNTMSETGQDTKCPDCDKVVTKRSGYHTQHINIKNGECSECGKKIYKNFTFSF
ncbi:MAG: AmmeMemoRadiSam system radical SAM enzyme [Odoribacter sp.]|nr:AmmeMemoRadiSam system radical SAM enzyme [Odoribacter sp.]